jgi:radical SAM superfamily enzyme YgiQ (UPF0313 family)
MKKVLLINSNTEILPYPVAPLGIALVASSLNGKYEVKVFDFGFETTQSLIEVIKKYIPDFIGISIRNIDNVTMRSCKWYLDEIKNSIIEPIKKNSNVPVIVGGGGFSIAPEQVFSYLDVDYGVVGEAEEILPKLLSDIENRTDIELENVITKNCKSIKIREHAGGSLDILNANIDKFINFEPYKNRGSYPIQTKRGCAHKCIYCSYPNIEGKEYRLRSAVEIVNEIEEVHKRIPEVNFEFVDSIFNSPLEHAVNICKEVICRDLKVSLRTMGVNPGEVTDELIELMKHAGFTQIDCTPDSAAELLIKNFRKNFTKNKLIECAEIIRNNDMPTMWFFMIGAPGETEDTILETFEFIDKYIYEEDMVHITEGIRIIPNTELYDIAIKEGVISKEMNVIEPMFYVSPSIGEENLTKVLEREIGKRNNVMNSINTAPSPQLMKATIKYRSENKINEPMFRSLLRVQNSSLKV